MNFIPQLLISALAVYFTAWSLPGVSIESYWTAIGVALVIGLLNTSMKLILDFFPVSITFTFGLFLLVINPIIIMQTSYFLSGFQVNSFWWALLFSIIVSFVLYFFMRIFKKVKFLNRNERDVST